MKLDIPNYQTKKELFDFLSIKQRNSSGSKKERD